MNLAQDPARLIVLLLSVVMLGIVGYGFASGNLVGGQSFRTASELVNRSWDGFVHFSAL